MSRRIHGLDVEELTQKETHDLLELMIPFAEDFELIRILDENVPDMVKSELSAKWEGVE